jgi:DNA-binding NtrC family response regulator
VYKGRKPITHPDFEKVVKIWRQGEITAVEAMKRLGMKSSTFYNKVREYENRQKSI